MHDSIGPMTKEEIVRLSTLARITLREEEIESLQSEIGSILEYVSQIDAATDGAPEKRVGAIHNVFREDIVTNEPNEHTEVLMDAMPETQGRFLKVKKILQNDD